MSFFARASWPGDHRDEIVAGALVAAVVVVLGYASGIGAPAPTTVTTTSPPASGASPTPHRPTSRSETGPPDTTAGTSGGGYWAGGGAAGIPVADSTPSTGGSGGHDHGAGPTTAPAPSPSSSSSPAPTPTPSPTATDSCDEGEVRLVKPLLNGLATPVTGLLDSLLAPTPSPSPSKSPDSLSSLCVGVAASPSLLSEVLP
ncbi:hypothetical protein [Streptomyces cylindrosporus]|uniref:Uncharacterized protein n=1 Tax=Streptomyces cylindrosporus TaxID=2927583 RepID=A0ABS9Y476_9ACTN|nr:hypothetical protein [Streptomyces cylindrosporus]MCI3271814.1 hypothetical protein [Streptomyces cylindrosporus]